MNTIEASIRNTKTGGDIKKLRLDGKVPGIIYGGEDLTKKISVSKNLCKQPSQSTYKQSGFLSNNNKSSITKSSANFSKIV